MNAPRLLGLLLPALHLAAALTLTAHHLLHRIRNRR